jgi:hypothetical protein
MRQFIECYYRFSLNFTTQTTNHIGEGCEIHAELIDWWMLAHIHPIPHWIQAHAEESECARWINVHLFVQRKMEGKAAARAKKSVPNPKKVKDRK